MRPLRAVGLGDDLGEIKGLVTYLSWLNVLLCKHGDLSQNPCKNWVMKRLVWNPSTVPSRDRQLHRGHWQADVA